MVYGFCISMIDLIVKHWCLAQLLATLPLQTSWTGDRSSYLVIMWLVPLSVGCYREVV